MIRRTVNLKIEQGLHLRACSYVTSLVSGYDGQVRIYNGDKSADASSMFDLVQLAALPNADLIVEISGEHAEQLMTKIEDLFAKDSVPTD